MAAEKEIKNHIALRLNDLLQSADVTATPEQIEKAIETLFKAFNFLKEAFSPDSSLFDYKGKASRSASLLGIGKKTYIEAALKQSQMLYRSPETINANIEGAAALLGIDKKTYIEAALKQPSLFPQSPETINANIEGAATLLGIDKKIYIEKAALKQPPLFRQSPETINANIEGAAALLGIDKKTYIEKAALKRPSLFYQSPETIDANIEDATRLLSIDKKIYIEKAALKQPQLFYQSPETIYKNYKFIEGVHAAGFIKNLQTTANAVMNFPIALTYSTKNTALRTAHAAMTKQSFKLSTFFAGNGRDKKTIETEVVSWLKDQFERTGFGDQVARNMHRNGLISTLPDWAAEPAND